MLPADPIAEFETENTCRIAEYASHTDWMAASARWCEMAFIHKYMYHFAWLGRPIIQLPADVLATQELIWRIRPDLIIETGIAHGGSLILSASMLALIEYAEAVAVRTVLDPANPKRRVLGVDIDIRAHNRAAIEAHPMHGRIHMIQGSSIAPEVIAAVKKVAKGCNRVMVFLDSNHTHDHVLAELEAYAPLVSPGSYCVVFDTVVEDLPNGFFADRPWDKGNNPKTAVWKYLENHKEFEIDKTLDSKLLITAASDGFLKRKA